MSERIVKMMNTKYGKNGCYSNDEIKMIELARYHNIITNDFFGVSGMNIKKLFEISKRLDKNFEFWFFKKENKYSSNLISNIKFSNEKICPYFHTPYKFYSQYNHFAKGYCEKDCCFIYENNCCKNMKNCQLFNEKDFFVNRILL